MDGVEMTLRIGDEAVTYKLAEVMKHSLDFDDSCFFYNITNELVLNHV